MIDSSAIIILYLGMLGASDSWIILSTGFAGISSMLFIIPGAALVGKLGPKRVSGISCAFACFGFMLMAAAPFFGPFRQAAAITGCLIHCLQRALHSASWYPLIDAFLRKEDRGSFFGTMRYTYMLFCGGLFYLIGKLMGDNPPILLMQCITGITAVLCLGRWYCVLKFPDNTMEHTKQLNISKSLGICVRNGPLVSYSVYACLLSAAYTSLVPLTLVYLKSYVMIPAGTVQIFSTVGIAGSVSGFLFYGFLLKKLKIKRLEMLVHFIFIVCPLVIFYFNKDTAGFVWIIGAAYFMGSAAASLFMCNNSFELMALARPGNKPMAMAFTQTYQNVGVSIGRTGTAMVMGANLLAPSWTFAGNSTSTYQTIFLGYAVIAAILLILIPTLPAVTPKHHDYYEPEK